MDCHNCDNWVKKGALMKNDLFENKLKAYDNLFWQINHFMTNLRIPLGVQIHNSVKSLKEIPEPQDSEFHTSDTCSTLDNSFDVDFDHTSLPDSPLTNIEWSKGSHNFSKSYCETSGPQISVASWSTTLNATVQLGKGTQGTVYLATDVKTKNKYALKICERTPKTRKSRYEDLCRERKILKSISHPFVIKYYDWFSSEKEDFFLLEFCKGGDMFHHLTKVKNEGKKGFSENTVKFYIACIVLALEELHEKGVVYRDLKPENILIDNEGYPKLCDFGLCYYTKDVNLSTCRKQWGSREYFAPEVVRRALYDQTVDWWWLGILAYELLNGNTPFANDNIFNEQAAIRNNSVVFNEEVPISKEWKDIIQSLLVKDQKVRLGTKGGHEIKAHPWFQDIDWEKLYSKQLLPPYDPKVDEKPETYYFDINESNAWLNMAYNLIHKRSIE